MMNKNIAYQNRINNAQGHHFENAIKAGCYYYENNGLAVIEQTPEPFRVTKTNRDGSFSGRFTANAQPDFKGVLAGGRAIVFEAKYTRTDKMKKSAVTDTQMRALDKYHELGAKAGVCIGIQDVFAFIPYTKWRDMKEIYGRQYLKVEDIEKYRIKFSGGILFLNYINE